MIATDTMTKEDKQKLEAIILMLLRRLYTWSAALIDKVKIALEENKAKGKKKWTVKHTLR